MKPKKLIKELKKQLRKESGNLVLRLKLAALYCETGQLSDAIQEYYSVAKVYGEARQWARAHAVCQSILALEPTHADTLALQSRVERALRAEARPSEVDDAAAGGKWVPSLAAPRTGERAATPAPRPGVAPLAESRAQAPMSRSTPADSQVNTSLRPARPGRRETPVPTDLMDEPPSSQHLSAPLLTPTPLPAPLAPHEVDEDSVVPDSLERYKLPIDHEPSGPLPMVSLPGDLSPVDDDLLAVSGDTDTAARPVNTSSTTRTRGATAAPLDINDQDTAGTDSKDEEPTGRTDPRRPGEYSRLRVRTDSDVERPVGIGRSPVWRATRRRGETSPLGAARAKSRGGTSPLGAARAKSRGETSPLGAARAKSRGGTSPLGVARAESSRGPERARTFRRAITDTEPVPELAARDRSATTTWQDEDLLDLRATLVSARRPQPREADWNDDTTSADDRQVRLETHDESLAAIREPGVLADIREPGVLADISEPGVLADIREPGVLADISEPGALVDDDELGVLADISEPGALVHDARPFAVEVDNELTIRLPAQLLARAHGDDAVEDAVDSPPQAIHDDMALGEVFAAVSAPAGAGPGHIPGPLGPFSGFPAEALDDLAARMTLRHYTANQHIVREGERGQACFSIVTGRVSVLRRDPLVEEAEPVEVTQLGDGAFFGESSLLAGRRRATSVRALDECLVYEISRRLLRELAATYAEVGPLLESVYRERLLSSLMQTCPFLRSLPASLQHELGERFQPMRCEIGERIVHEGQSGGGLYLVVLGSLEVTRRLSQKRSVVLATLDEGAYLGEMAFVQSNVACATVSAAGPTELAVLAPEDFQEIVQTNPHIWPQLVQQGRRHELESHELCTGETLLV